MSRLALKPTDKAIKKYFADMHEKRQMGFKVEGNVAPAFADLLGQCAKLMHYIFNEQHALKLPNKRSIRLDGAILTPSRIRMGIWEAKDSQDDLRAEIKKKFAAGYPNDNILFQAPEQAILIQGGREVLAVTLSPEQPQALADVLNAFFSYSTPAIDAWENAVAEFKTRVPEVAQGLDELIEREYQRNAAYKSAFDSFLALCRSAINPQLSKDAVEEMLIQHILTERIFRRVFNNDKFTRQNAIAREIESVIDALTSKAFSRDDFTRGLDHFYGAIEQTASTISAYDEKQDFLNTVYEQFFQGFSVKTADTHGIVYTPQAIVQFMVKSVERLLQREFGRSLADRGVHVLDPFVGTGNFLLRVMEEIRALKPSALAHKYAHELHCNELMLLPYYIASMNLEHAYYDAMGEYAPFEGICLVDTFDLAEARQLPMFAPANSERVARQQKSELTVILGNPPYNANQANENDNNKNRKYAVLDQRVQETYVKASKATLRNKLSDPYVKAFRWASDRLKGEGVIAYISNNSFIDNIAFDGMRQHLLADFDALYVLDLGGNVRKNPKLSGTTHNVFGIQVGVCISFLVRHARPHDSAPRQGKLYYARMEEFWRRGQKYQQLDAWHDLSLMDWQALTPDAKHNWLTAGMEKAYETFLPLGTKDAKAGRGQAIFETYSLGISTNRDSVVYDFDSEALQERMIAFLDAYNSEVDRYKRAGKPKEVDAFLKYEQIKWSRNLKRHLSNGDYAEFDANNLRHSLYRPFASQNLYFADIAIDELSKFPYIFPTPETEAENRVICVSAIGNNKPFHCLMTNLIPDLHLTGDSQCFPLYRYAQADDGTWTRHDNLSDWALAQYQAHYQDASISKEDIFYHLYALLHHPDYRTKYAANLKRELPRVPFVALTLNPSPEGRGTSLPPSPLGRRAGDEGALLPSPLVGDEGNEGAGKEYVSRALIHIARELRQRETPAEDILWEALRNRRLADAKFRRQHPIDKTRYIADFYCHEHRLVVELDGSIHDTQQEADATRQAELEALGLRVLRFPNEVIYQNLEGVLETIVDALTLNPSPLGRGTLLPPSPLVGDEGNEGALPPSPLVGDEGITGALLPSPLGRRAGDEGIFHLYARVGRALADLHLDYERLPEHPLTRRENPRVPPSLRVEKMKLSKDKTSLQVNEFLTLEGIPPETYAYKLGNRSALEWVIEQLQVSTDSRSGITNDPNRLDDEGYIVRLVGQVIHVSLETQKLLAHLPPL